MSAASEEPILTRLNRLDLILKQLEEMRGDHSPKSSTSYASNSSGSDGHPADWCRPLNDVMLEVQQKGNLIDRLVHAEDRILKQLEEDFQTTHSNSNSSENKSPKKGFKQFVKSCVKPKHKTSIFSS